MNASNGVKGAFSIRTRCRGHLEGNSRCPRSTEGLDDRCRDQNGQIRAKNGSTLIRTLRETYGDGFAPNVRGDMKLDTLLERKGAQSLSHILKNR
jgi:hypothetical protein